MTPLTLRRFRRPALALALIGIALSAGPADAARTSCPGVNLVQSAARSFASAYQSRDSASFARAISNYSDVTSIALFALGRFRSSLPPQRQPEYVAKVRAFMGRFLADHASQFANANLQITSCAGGQIRSVAGRSDIVWKVSGSRVRDIQVDGVSLVGQLRSKFVSVLNRGNGDIAALFEFLDQNS